jgi:hypothetical protein
MSTPIIGGSKVYTIELPIWFRPFAKKWPIYEKYLKESRSLRHDRLEGFSWVNPEQDDSGAYREVGTLLSKS